MQAAYDEVSAVLQWKWELCGYYRDPILSSSMVVFSLAYFPPLFILPVRILMGTDVISDRSCCIFPNNYAYLVCNFYRVSLEQCGLCSWPLPQLQTLPGSIA